MIDETEYSRSINTQGTLSQTEVLIITKLDSFIVIRLDGKNSRKRKEPKKEPFRM